MYRILPGFGEIREGGGRIPCPKFLFFLVHDFVSSPASTRNWPPFVPPIQLLVAGGQKKLGDQARLSQ